MVNYVILKIKKNLISIMSIFFIIFLIIYSKSNINAVKEGLELWINNVVPSLFPFFIATEILYNTNFINIIGNFLEKPISKLFNVPGEGAFALIMGTISGYPSGAKIVANLKKERILNNEESERLIAFTNNSGPLFILGTVGECLLKNSHIGYCLLISHLISCILVGIIFRNWKKSKLNLYKYNNKGTNIEKSKGKEKNVKIEEFGEILGNSIINSIKTIVIIGGFIVFFSVLISILNSINFIEFFSKIFNIFNIPKDIGNGIIFGIIELTNGLGKISLIPLNKINICFISFLIGFGGLSVLFQVYSIISKENISIKPYFYGKVLQGIFSFFITYLLLSLKNPYLIVK